MTQTPLFHCHEQANAKFIDFFGWQMPIHYGSLVNEHLQVRNDAGIFDVSHMTIVDVSGHDAGAFLRYLLANDVFKLKNNGSALYTCMLAENGGILDDLLVYKLRENDYRLVVNCATRASDIAWIMQQSSGYSVAITEQPTLAMLALQGPHAIAKADCILPAAFQGRCAGLVRFQSIHLDGWLVARTGYTGEDGLEIILPAAAAPTFWQNALAQGFKPCGLGARDSLRLEAGLNLYGQDMDNTVSPFESNLGWTVALSSEDRNFIGKAALKQQQHHGIPSQLVGIVLLDKGVLRAHQIVSIPDLGQGITTSGGYSPSLKCAIGLARIPIGQASTGFVAIRHSQHPIKIVAPPFIRNNKATFTLD